MAFVAVAGGSSRSLGRCIVSAILKTKNTPIILSRKKDDGSAQTSECYGAEVRYVDYSSVASLTDALKDVETVISVLKIPGPEWYTHQINLLSAAKAAGVKRFAPSEFEAGPLATGLVDVTAVKGEIWKACKQSGLECARFCCGMFMNYLAFGTDNQEMRQGLMDDPIIWYNEDFKAILPVKEDGTFPSLTLTELSDIGRFIAAACELPLGQWEPIMGMTGETIQIDEVVKILEQKSGHEYNVTTIDKSQLQETVDSIEGFGSNMRELYDKLNAQMELMMLQDKENMGRIVPTVNRLCPHIKPFSVEEYVALVFAQSLPWFQD